MTLPDERRRAILRGRNLLLDLITPSKTPGVPAAVRQEAMSILKHYPTQHDITLSGLFEDTLSGGAEPA